jgi:hypothetical protein
MSFGLPGRLPDHRQCQKFQHDVAAPDQVQAEAAPSVHVEASGTPAIERALSEITYAIGTARRAASPS